MKVVHSQTESFEKYKKHQSQFLYLVLNYSVPQGEWLTSSICLTCSGVWFYLSALHSPQNGNLLQNLIFLSRATESETLGVGPPDDSKARNLLLVFFPTEDKSPISQYKFLALGLTQASSERMTCLPSSCLSGELPSPQCRLLWTCQLCI